MGSAKNFVLARETLSVTAKEARRKKAPKRVLALPDLEHAQTAVLSSLTSNGKRTHDHAIRESVGWYCSEPRLAFDRTVALRYRIHLEERQYAPATITSDLPLSAASRGRVLRAINKISRIWGDA